MVHMPQAAASLHWAALSPQGAGEWDGTGSVGRGKTENVALKLDPAVQWCFWREKNVLSVQSSVTCQIVLFEIAS